jgi:hypothetical protein
MSGIETDKFSDFRKPMKKDDKRVKRTRKQFGPKSTLGGGIKKSVFYGQYRSKSTVNKQSKKSYSKSQLEQTLLDKTGFCLRKLIRDSIADTIEKSRDKHLSNITDEVINQMINKFAKAYKIAIDSSDYQCIYTEFMYEIISLLVITPNIETKKYVLSIKNNILKVKKSKEGFGIFDSVFWSKAFRKSKNIESAIDKEHYIMIVNTLVDIGCDPFETNSMGENAISSYLESVNKKKSPYYEEVINVLQLEFSEKILIDIFNKFSHDNIGKIDNRIKYAIVKRSDKVAQFFFKKLMKSYQYSKKKEVYPIVASDIRTMKEFLLSPIINDEFKGFLENNYKDFEGMYSTFIVKLNSYAISYDLSHHCTETEPLDIKGAIIGECRTQYSNFITECFKNEFTIWTQKQIITSTAHLLWSYERETVNEIINNLSDEEIKQRYIKTFQRDYFSKYTTRRNGYTQFDYGVAYKSLTGERVRKIRRSLFMDKNDFLKFINKKEKMILISKNKQLFESQISEFLNSKIIKNIQKCITRTKNKMSQSLTVGFCDMLSSFFGIEIEKTNLNKIFSIQKPEIKKIVSYGRFDALLSDSDDDSDDDDKDEIIKEEKFIEKLVDTKLYGKLKIGNIFIDECKDEYKINTTSDYNLENMTSTNPNIDNFIYSVSKIVNEMNTGVVIRTIFYNFANDICQSNLTSKRLIRFIKIMKDMFKDKVLKNSLMKYRENKEYFDNKNFDTKNGELYLLKIINIILNE